MQQGPQAPECGSQTTESKTFYPEEGSPSPQGSSLSLEGSSHSLEGIRHSLQGSSPSLEGIPLSLGSSHSLEGISLSLQGSSPSLEGIPVSPQGSSFLIFGAVPCEAIPWRPALAPRSPARHPSRPPLAPRSPGRYPHAEGCHPKKQISLNFPRAGLLSPFARLSVLQRVIFFGWHLFPRALSAPPPRRRGRFRPGRGWLAPPAPTGNESGRRCRRPESHQKKLSFRRMCV